MLKGFALHSETCLKEAHTGKGFCLPSRIISGMRNLEGLIKKIPSTVGLAQSEFRVAKVA